ncbi:MAG: hypothetical protein IT350_10035 [Deltaproteobacteria bacterium]|nr:hypothetical protein [Deltaproteobacteria bacterium]
MQRRGIKRQVLVMAAVMAASLVSATYALALDAAELQAFLEVGMYEEVQAMCAENAAEVAANGQLASLCAKAKGGGVSSAPAPSAPAPSAPSAPAPSAPSAPSMSSPSPSAPSAPVPVPTAPAPTFVPDAGGGLDAGMLENMVRSGQHGAAATICNDNEGKINSHPDRDRIRKACGQAKMAMYSSNKMDSTSITGAVGDLEQSLKMSYDGVASFDLGKSRILTLDTVPTEAEKSEKEKQAVREMWDAIVMRHAEENFNPAVSDQIIVWTIGNGADQVGYVDLVIDRVFKDEGNRARQRWMASRLRMLSDRFTNIDPNQGESETRRGNLETLKFWMTELYEYTYFDNDIEVGMYRYKGNRYAEKYDQTEATEEQFQKALFFYSEARNRADTQKAKAALDRDLAYLCSRYRSDDQQKLVKVYQQGFLKALRGIQIMDLVNRVQPEQGKSFYRYEEANAELASELQKSYGQCLTGYIYYLYLTKNYVGVVALKNRTLDAGFDWEGKSEVLLIFAESAKELAAASMNNETQYRKYKEMCLAGGSRALKFALRKYGGKAPTGYDETFCRTFNTYWNYLTGFGQKVEAKALENQFGAICPAEGGTAPAAPAQ